MRNLRAKGKKQHLVDLSTTCTCSREEKLYSPNFLAHSMPACILASNQCVSDAYKHITERTVWILHHSASIIYLTVKLCRFLSIAYKRIFYIQSPINRSRNSITDLFIQVQRDHQSADLNGWLRPRSHQASAIQSWSLCCDQNVCEVEPQELKMPLLNVTTVNL